MISQPTTIINICCYKKQQTPTTRQQPEQPRAWQ
jgi:hypothetical protein